MYKNMRREVVLPDLHEDVQIGEQVQEYGRRRRVYGEKSYHADNTNTYEQY